MKYLFIGGCQRSGTTALADLLNEDPRIVLGRERYKRIVPHVTPEHFTPERFFHPERSETNHLQYHRESSPLHEKYVQGGVEYMGDKVPRYFTAMRRILKVFPESRFVFLLRDLEGVANSFQKRALNPDDTWPVENDYREAPTFWNKSLQHLARVMDTPHIARVFVVHYERFYAGEEEYLRGLYEFLDLDLPDHVADSYRASTEGWEDRVAQPAALDAKMLTYLDEHRDVELERAALSLCPERVG